MLALKTIETFIARHIEGIKPHPADLAYYRKAVGADKVSHHINSPETENLLADSILFVSDRPNYFFLRLSLSFQKKKYKTILLTRWGVEAKQKMFFDHIVLYDNFFDLKKLKTCNTRMIYIQSWVGWSFLPVYIRCITRKNVACNVNDLIHLLFNTKEHGMLIGLSREESKMDMLCEKIILEEFDIVTMPYRLQSVARISSKLHSRFEKNIFYFPCYPSPAFFSSGKNADIGKPVHLLFIGGIPPDHKPDSVFRDAKLHAIMHDLLQLSFRITLFNNPQLSRTRKKLKEQYPYFTKLSEENNRFEFRNGYPPWQLSDHMGRFHYGLMIYCFDGLLISPDHYRNIVPTKFFTYMELGIPVVAVDEMAAVSEIIRENDIGIVVSQDEIKRLNHVLAECKTRYKTMIENIRIYRNENSLDKKLDKLIGKLDSTETGPQAPNDRNFFQRVVP